MAAASATFIETIRLYGLAADQAARDQARSRSSQSLGETIAATVGRQLKGPKINGHFSLHGKVTSAFGAGSLLTVWYSNLPDPDPDVDTDWVQDTAIASQDLTLTTAFFINVGNVNAQWVRVKVVRATSSGDLYVWARVEGPQNR